MNLKQPVLGLAAAVLVMAVALGLISRFDFPTFSTWVAYLIQSMIPVEIVMGVLWGTQHPEFAGSRPQPLKGVLLIVVTAVLGAIIAYACFETVGGGFGPPAPMLIMYSISLVLTTFWAAIMMGGWPWFKLIADPFWAGLATIVACCLLTYVIFRLFFDYGFMQGAPVYVPSLDPHGWFNAWNAVVFYFTGITIMFLMLHFDLWPLTRFPAVMEQPKLGLVWSLAAFLVGGLVFYVAIGLLKIDVVLFMVNVDVAFVFGTIIVLNMLQGSLTPNLTQPHKGIRSALFAMVIGTLLLRGYGMLSGAVTGPLPSGPPSYDFQIWTASALLGVTFPFLIFYADYFKMWPLHKPDAA